MSDIVSKISCKNEEIMSHFYSVELEPSYFLPLEKDLCPVPWSPLVPERRAEASEQGAETIGVQSGPP